jgi:septal ring factor EnvC (AmiA/AmiB activator)
MLKSSAPYPHQPLRKNSLICALIVFTIVLAPILSPKHTQARANELDEKRDSLQQVKHQITKAESELQQKKAAEKSALQQLEEFDQKIATNDEDLQTAAQQIQQSRKSIKELEEKMASYSSILKRSQRDIEKRLCALYTSGDMSTLRLIFSTETPLELAENMDFLGRISGHDKRLLSSYRQRMNQFHTAQQELAAQIDSQKTILSQQQNKRQQLEVSRKKRHALVTKIRRDSNMLNGLLKELEDRSRRMTNLVKDLEEKLANAYIPTSKSLLAAKGQIPWPSSGAVRSEFGTRKNKGFAGQHKNNGLVIAAVPGSNIKAIWPGRIAFAAPFKGYGNLIIIDHGNKYYSLYAQAAHLDLPVGTVVKQGDIITSSGFAGRDSYYLEIRHGGSPMNPRDWLMPRKW